MSPFFPGDDLHQIELNLDRIVVLRQTDPLAYSADVGIDGNPGYAVSISQEDIGGLSSYAGKGHQFFQGVWNLASESGHQPLATLLNGSCLVVIESCGANVFLQLFQRGPGIVIC